MYNEHMSDVSCMEETAEHWAKFLSFLHLAWSFSRIFAPSFSHLFIERSLELQLSGHVRQLLGRHRYTRIV
jgi:hypothetical protein